MKQSTVMMAFLGGALLGAIAGILLAPDKGSENRKKLLEALEKAGVPMSKEELSDLVSRLLDPDFKEKSAATAAEATETSVTSVSDAS